MHLSRPIQTNLCVDPNVQPRPSIIESCEMLNQVCDLDFDLWVLMSDEHRMHIATMMDAYDIGNIVADELLVS